MFVIFFINYVYFFSLIRSPQKAKISASEREKIYHQMPILGSHDENQENLPQNEKLKEKQTKYVKNILFWSTDKDTHRHAYLYMSFILFCIYDFYIII